MARFNQAIIDAVNQKVINAYEMLYVDMDGGIYVTNAPTDISYGGNTYISLGNFLGFSGIEEQSDFTINEITISLSGVPAFDDGGNSFINVVLQYDYIDKPVQIYRAFFNRDTFIDAFLMFEGRINAPMIQDDPGGTTTVGVTVSNNWVDYDRVNGMITNNDRHQSLYPGDLFFEHANETTKDIAWKPPQVV